MGGERGCGRAQSRLAGAPLRAGCSAACPHQALNKPLRRADPHSPGTHRWPCSLACLTCHLHKGRRHSCWWRPVSYLELLSWNLSAKNRPTSSLISMVNILRSLNSGSHVHAPSAVAISFTAPSLKQRSDNPAERQPSRATTQRRPPALRAGRAAQSRRGCPYLA